MLDLHLHSTNSGDGLSSIARYADQARQAGLAVVGFCEHADFDPRDHGGGYPDPARYGAELAAAAEEVPEVRLCRGVEISYQAGFEAQIRTWLSAHAWDYVVASVHLIDYADGWAIVSEPQAIADYFAGHSRREAYRPYFEELLRAAQSGLGHVLGHFDLIKRYGVTCYGPFEPAAFQDEIRAVLRAAVASGLGLEINTSGLRQAPGEPYPGLDVLRWYRELGGEIITAGSDAHRARDLGAGIPAALDLARAAGFRVVAYFDQGQPRWLDL
jgi:histidinol-phosphatase (PHP family)